MFIAPPSLILQPTPEEMVHSGSNVALLCTAVGYPTPTVTWLKNMGELGIDSRYSVISNNGSGILYITNVSVFDEGSYSCVASQSFNSIVSLQSTNLIVIDCKLFNVCMGVYYNIDLQSNIYDYEWLYEH